MTKNSNNKMNHRESGPNPNILPKRDEISPINCYINTSTILDDYELDQIFEYEEEYGLKYPFAIKISNNIYFNIYRWFYT